MAFKYEFNLALPPKISINIISTFEWWNFHLNGVYVAIFPFKVILPPYASSFRCAYPSYLEVESPILVIAYPWLNYLPLLVFMVLFCMLLCSNVSTCLLCLSILLLISTRLAFNLAKASLMFLKVTKLLESSYSSLHPFFVILK